MSRSLDEREIYFNKVLKRYKIYKIRYLDLLHHGRILNFEVILKTMIKLYM